FKDFLMLGRNRIADEKRPCDVVVDGMRGATLGPHIDKQEVAFLHREIVLQIRSEVRIRAMRIDRDNWRMSRSEVALLILFQNELLNLNLRDRNAISNAPPNFLHDLIDDLPHVLGGIQMRLQLLIAPHRLEHLDQIGRRYNFDSEAPNQFDSAG